MFREEFDSLWTEGFAQRRSVRLLLRAGDFFEEMDGAAFGPGLKPGAEIEVMAFSMPLRSIASMECCGVHSGVLPATIRGPMRPSPTLRT